MHSEHSSVTKKRGIPSHAVNRSKRKSLHSWKDPDTERQVLHVSSYVGAKKVSLNVLQKKITVQSLPGSYAEKCKGAYKDTG